MAALQELQLAALGERALRVGERAIARDLLLGVAVDAVAGGAKAVQGVAGTIDKGAKMIERASDVGKQASKFIGKTRQAIR